MELIALIATGQVSRRIRLRLSVGPDAPEEPEQLKKRLEAFVPMSPIYYHYIGLQQGAPVIGVQYTNMRDALKVRPKDKLHFVSSAEHSLFRLIDTCEKALDHRHL